VRARLAIGMCLMAACGGDSPTAASSTKNGPSAAISVTIEAEPVRATADPLTPMLAKWTIVIRETAAVAGTLTYVNSTLRDAATGTRAWPTGTSSLTRDTIIERLGSDRVPAGGTVRVEGGLQYAFRSGGTVGRLTVAVQLVDDNGHTLSATAEAEIR
jgi:hypothetical protein